MTGLRAKLPSAEHLVDEALVRGLLADQHPELATLPLSPVGEGWDNAMFRLGDELAVRLPRRQAGASLILTEQRWLPSLAPSLPIATPAPVRVGGPGRGYPWAWSVTPWLPGEPAERRPLRADQGGRLGAFLRALHRAAPAEAPFNPHRSVPLAERATTTAPQLARLARTRPDLPLAEIEAVWAAGVAAPIDRQPTWIHGDLHARNVLSLEGALSGVIDWGDMARGDPAMDLYCLWMLLPEAASREAAIAAYGGVSHETLRRARAWAAAMGAVLIESGDLEDPGLAALGERILRALLEGPGA